MRGGQLQALGYAFPYGPRGAVFGAQGVDLGNDYVGVKMGRNSQNLTGLFIGHNAAMAPVPYFLDAESSGLCHLVIGFQALGLAHPI